MPLSPAALQQLSDELAFARPDSCAIKRLTTSRDAGGAPTSTRTTVATVSCRVEMRDRLSAEGIVGGRLTPVTEYLIALPYGTVVQEDDILTVNSAQDFEIIGDSGVTSYHAEVEVQARTTR